MAQPCSPAIIYFDYHADEERHRRKFAGICRFAKACGWRVAAVPPEQSRPASVRGLLARYNFGGETWQHARPLADLRLEGVRASGLWLPVALNGGSSKDGDMPIDITMSECSLAFAKPQPEVFSVATVRTMRTSRFQGCRRRSSARGTALPNCGCGAWRGRRPWLPRGRARSNARPCEDRGLIGSGKCQ